MKDELTYKDKVISDIKTIYPDLTIEIGVGDRLLINGVLLKGIIVCDYMEKIHELNIKSILVEIEHQYLSKQIK